MPIANYNKSDTLNGVVDTGSLYSELVEASLPITAVNDSLDSFFTVDYSRNLTDVEAALAVTLISAHTGEAIAQEIIQYQQVLSVGGQRVTDRGFQFDAIAGQTTNFDFAVTEDLFVKEGFAIAYDFNKRDSVSMAIVHPLAGPLHYYLKDLPLDVHRGDKTVGIVRASNAAITETNFNGLIIRMTYTSTGATDVHVCVTMRTYS
jgi:hypothetical protein